MENAKNDSDFRAILIGFSIELTVLVEPHFDGLKTKQIHDADEFEVLIDHFSVEPGTPCFVSTEAKNIGYLEVAQALNSCFPGLELIFVTEDRSKFEMEVLKKNGFNSFHILPLDRDALFEQIEDAKAKAVGGLKRRFSAVKLVDLQAGEKLPFGVFTFLPLNNKYVPLSRAGTISEKKFEILRQRDVNDIYIEKSEIQKFYDFTAERLASLSDGEPGAISETEKSERLKQSVRTLFRSILNSGTDSNFESGRELANTATKVVETYLNKKTGADLSASLGSIVGENSDSYTRAQAVSAIVCLISLATGIGVPEEMAIAGLFHDIGLQGFKREMDLRAPEDLNDFEKTVFHQHPVVSLSLLKEKKVTITAEIGEMIEKHHERVDGKGFPAGIRGHKIPVTAQLLGYADAFETITRRRPGKPGLNGEEAHALISKELGLSPELLSMVRNALGYAA